MPLCRQLCLGGKRPRCQSFMSCAPLSGTRARAPPSVWFPQNLFLICAESFRNAPQHPNTKKKKQTDLVVFGPFPNYPFFPFFPFPFFPLFGDFRISAFSVFWVGACLRKPSHSTGCIFLPLVPSQTQSHSPKTAKRTVENATIQVNCCCWLPRAIHQCRHRCVVSRHGGQRTQWPKNGP